MKWHTFTGPESRVPAPDFCLTSDAGDTICDHVYRQRMKQVLVFPVGNTPAEWTPILRTFSEHAEGLNRQGAVVLALLPAEPQAIQGIGRGLAYHFPIVADPGAQVRRAYEALLRGDTGTSHLVFVLDTFGAPYAAAINADPTDEGLFDQISEWLTFITAQCPA